MSAQGITTRPTDLEQILGRDQRISRAGQQIADQHVADLDQLRAVDRRFDVHLGQVRGRLLFDRLIDRLAHARRDWRGRTEN